MPGRTSDKAPKNPCNDLNSSYASQGKNCYEGERLTNLLQSIRREIESTRHLDGSSLPEKIWLKQQFSIGVNDVTRVLERMTPCSELGSSPQLPSTICRNPRVSTVKLKAVLVASDCNPRWLTKHLLGLASSRKVPVIFVKDDKEGSLRLGELVKLKTALAVGIKAKENNINKLFDEILHGNATIESDWSNSARIADKPSSVQVSDRKGELQS
ncbi:hypothetical protein L6164_010362 [Bauhinia variegata]|uniref:Uncharacterized protein n=1 Tax=Bauhinia variegata TaxID=167791 RepID=A0ACB9PN08_BAUVA|nr:hypothetical protein L6164_010362 [Bauhinia variegata]